MKKQKWETPTITNLDLDDMTPEQLEEFEDES